MDKIEVGEYVRNKFGDIYKIDYLEDYHFLSDKFYNNIVNHSKNLKNLVQALDVIKYKYSKISRIENIGIVVKNTDYRTLKEYLSVNDYKLEQVDILEILTKEQFEKNCYKVVE